MLLRSAAWKGLIDVESEKPTHDTSIDISTLKQDERFNNLPNDWGANRPLEVGTAQARINRNRRLQEQVKVLRHGGGWPMKPQLSWQLRSDDLFTASLDFLPSS